MLRYVILITFFIGIYPVFAQYTDNEWSKIMTTYNDEQLFMESSTLLAEGYYVTAEKIIDKLIATDPANNNLNYRKGFVLCEGKHLYNDAIGYLERASSDVEKNYDAFSPNEKSAPLDLYFFLAKSYHRTGNIEKAKEGYERFLSTASSKTKNQSEAETALEQLEQAERLLLVKKKNVTIENIGSVVNTGSPEYSPVISFDGSALYFTSRRAWENGNSAVERDPQSDFFMEDIYVSYRDNNNEWSEPKRLDFCKEDQNEASVSVSSNERKIYVYQDIVGNGDIFFSEFKNNKFGKINHFEDEGVNTEDYWETHCFVTPDGRNMYFASQRKGGYGGRDIYRVVKLPDGTWSQPLNLGPSINTPYDEDAPFMSIDNKTLYFASNGPKSIGGFDIFVSIVDQTNQWSDPINLGIPVNSFDDDLFYTETLDGRQGFLTSVREDSKGDKDIYQVNNDYLNKRFGRFLKGYITTSDNSPLPEDVTISLVCTSCESDLYNTTSYPRLRDGLYGTNLQPCAEYEIVVAKKDGSEEFYRTPINTACDVAYEELRKDVVIDIINWKVIEPKDTVPVIDTIPEVDSVPDVIVFNPLRFKHNFSYNGNVLSVNDGALKTFVGQVEDQLAKGKKNIVIHIKSSASYVPTGRFKNNEELAQRRAENIQKELTAYFKKAKKDGSVRFVIDSVTVSGPAYSGDNDNESKYVPYQFIELSTE